MQRPKRLTKRERKAQSPAQGQAQGHNHAHIHCIACGRHIEPDEFAAASPSAEYLTCDHNSRFPSCTDCVDLSRRLIREHDATGNPVQSAGAWH